MVDTVAVPNPPADDKNAEANAAGLKAAEEGGVVVNGETVTPGEPVKAERPEGVPEKFWDAEKGEVKVDAVLASNKELQSQFTKSKQKDGDTPEETEEVPAGDQPNPVLAAREFYDANGTLSDEHYESLEKAGLPREYVDSYIQGQEALAQSVMTHAYGLAGGTEESFNEMNAWAAQNLSEEELTSHNALVINDETSDFAIARLYERYLAERPNETPLLDGGTPPGSTGDYFKSSAEMQEAMGDPRYAKDDAYRKEVERKIQRADAAGVNLFS